MTPTEADDSGSPAAASGVPPRDRAPRAWRSIAARWVPVLLVVAGCGYLARTVDLHQLEASLVSVTLWPLGMAVLFATTMVVVKATYWWLLCKQGSHVPFRAMVTYGFAANATNTVVPMRGGDALRLWLVQRRHGVPVVLSAAVIALEKIGDVASLLLIVSPLPWLIPDLPPTVAQALRVLPCIVLAGVVAVAVAGAHSGRWSFLQGFAVLRRPAVVAGGFGLVFLSWALDVCAILSVLFACHVAPTPEKALLVMLSVNVATAIPATPGQLGAHELGSTIALGLVGVHEAQAIPFALLYHASQVVPVLLIGLWSARALSRGPDAPPPNVA
jgi:uncharacterized membrane protein YbhN (UPF0104 family)